MPAARDNLSVVIPTKDHLEDLRRLLRSLSEQSVRPSEVIVVDGGALPVEPLVLERWPFAARYERVFPPGLAKQQNAGIRRVSPSSTLVAFIDDDIVLERDAVKRMMIFWRDAKPEIGGAAFNLVDNTSRPRHVWFKSLFGLDSSKQGMLLRSGYQTKIGAVDRTIEVEWLYGGATVWRRELFNSDQFDEWFEGPGHLYELEFCVRAARGYRMVVVADARVREVAAARSWNDTPLGRWQVVNRLYFVRKHRAHPRLSLARCWGALIGQVAVNVCRGIVERDGRYLQRAYGNCTGMYEAVTARPQPSELKSSGAGTPS